MWMFELPTKAAEQSRCDSAAAGSRFPLSLMNLMDYLPSSKCCHFMFQSEDRPVLPIRSQSTLCPSESKVQQTAEPGQVQGSDPAPSKFYINGHAHLLVSSALFSCYNGKDESCSGDTMAHRAENT